MATTKTVKKLVPVAGEWKAAQPFQLKRPDSLGFGLALTTVRASRGVVEATVSLADVSGGTCGITVGFDAMKGTGIFLAIGGFSAAYSIGRFVLGQGAVALATAGGASGLVAKRWYNIKVKVEGLVLSLEPRDADGGRNALWIIPDDHDRGPRELTVGLVIWAIILGVVLSLTVALYGGGMRGSVFVRTEKLFEAGARFMVIGIFIIAVTACALLIKSAVEAVWSLISK